MGAPTCWVCGAEFMYGHLVNTHAVKAHGAEALVAFTDEIERLTTDLAAERARAAALSISLAEHRAALQALLNHYRRHTQHRCEIDRDAKTVLDAYRALAPAPREGEGTD